MRPDVTYEPPSPATPFTCVKRDCQYNGFDLHPYCKKAKNLRDAGGNELQDGFGRDIPGAADVKYLVDADGNTVADGTPIEQTYIPPAKLHPWLDQFVSDAPLGAIFASEVVYTDPDLVVRDCAVAGQCTSRRRARANYVATGKPDAQVASMATLRTAVDSAAIDGAFPYMFMYLYYEQYAIIQHEAVMNLALALVAVFIIRLVMIANLGATLMVCVASCSSTSTSSG